jgi:hypothetical protein
VVGIWGTRLNNMQSTEKSKRYREKNREQLRLNAIKYREDNKEKIKERRQSKLSYYKKYKPDELKIKIKEILKKRYGITFEEYNEMFNKQEGKCGICKTPQIKIKKVFCVDHNHKTEKVRNYCVKNVM